MKTPIQSSLYDKYRLVIESITDTAWISSMHYELMWISPSVSSSRGFSPDALQQIPLQRQMKPDSFKALQALISELVSKHDPSAGHSASATIELELYRKDRSTFWSEEKISVFFNSKNSPIHIIGIGRDVSNRKRTEQTLAYSEQLYHNLFNYFPTGMYRTTPGGTIIEVNPALVAMLKADDIKHVVGKNAREFFVDPDDRQKQQQRLETEEKLLQSELQMKCFDGSMILVRDNARVVRNEEGTILFYEGSLEDITKEKKAENALRESEEKYRTLILNMSEGLTIVDMNENVLYSNPSADEMFGVKQGTMIGRNLSEFLEPKQLQSVQKQTLNRIKGERSSYEIEIKRPDGQVRHLQVTATPQLDANGRIISSFGVIHDNTQRKRNENIIQQTQNQLALQLQENEKRRNELNQLTILGNSLQACSVVEELFPVLSKVIESLFQRTSGAFYIIDESGLTMKKRLAWGLLSTSEIPTLAEDCWSMRTQKPYEKNPKIRDPFCKHVLDAKTQPSCSYCIPILSRDRSIGMIHVETSPDQGLISIESQKLWCMIAEQMGLVITNINLRENLRQQAIRDPLTGMYNRYYLEESFHNELERARRGQYPLGIIMLDFDHFKELNTICGHPQVDEMLKAFGKLVKSEFRASDICCRYGGDEFLILLPEASMEVTFSRAQKLLKVVQQLTVYKCDTSHPVTISAGVAVFPDHGQTIDQLLTSVDEALLKAKRVHDHIEKAP